MTDCLVVIAVLSLKLSAGVNVGDLLTLCCAVGFEFHIFYTSKFVKDEDAVLLTIVQMAVAAVISLLVVIFKGETSFSLRLFYRQKPFGAWPFPLLF